MKQTFEALLLEQQDGKPIATIKTLDRDALPEGDVLVKVAYSSLNYKDGLAILGRNKVVRSYPMVPGIDFAGTVLESKAPAYKPGDEVVLTGWGVGERHWGGMAQLARVKSDWLVPAPKGLSLQQAMGIGTAGFTAMLCLLALEERGLTPGEGREVVVTGASGGVGSMAVALGTAMGHAIVAATGREETHDYLKSLGAKTIIDRAELTAPSGPLGTARWAGAVDTVGGDVLAGVLRTLAYGATAAACGNAGGPELHTTILPFILRAVSLIGIDSLPVPLERRRQVWNRITQILSPDILNKMMHVATLVEMPTLAHQILQGQIQGRVVVDVNA